ncbi:MAG: hypothetical protein Q9201_002792 [Fulgogasparrea decipioides]
MHQYASDTPEACELVAELEFVWDQIKANSNNTSSESSPQGAAGETNLGIRYASLGGSTRVVGRSGAVGGGSRLSVLRPVSDGDEEYDDGDEESEEFNSDGARYVDPQLDQMAGGRKTRDLDIRNRKWRKRIEIALFKMTTEVAALREQVEAKRIGSAHGKNSGAWAWIRWLIWTAVRQLLVDAMIVGLVLLWARRKNDQRIEQGLWLVMQAVKEQLKWVRGLKIWRLKGLR